MSTKAIREALSEYLMLADADPRGASPRERGVHAAALSEVEAIERAATDLAEHGTRFAKDESMDLIQAIAEQDD